MWEDIAILSRYLLMLSFNDSLDGTTVFYTTIQPYMYRQRTYTVMAAYYSWCLSNSSCFCLVANNLPHLFHIIISLVCMGPLFLRATIHGILINIIQSLSTCTSLELPGVFRYIQFQFCPVTFFKH